jgi:hypothetical protein
MKEETHDRLVKIACKYLEQNYEDLAHNYRHNSSDFWTDTHNKSALLNRLKNNKEDLYWFISEIHPHFYNHMYNEEDGMFDSSGTTKKNVYHIENMYFIIDSDTHDLVEVAVERTPIIIYQSVYKKIQ